MIAARASERRAQHAQGGRLGIPRAGRRHVDPRLLAVEVDQRAEQHVFLEPPALGLDEPREGRLARRAGGRLGHLVARERGRERFGLRVPHVRVVDPRGRRAPSSASRAPGESAITPPAAAKSSTASRAR